MGSIDSLRGVVCSLSINPSEAMLQEHHISESTMLTSRISLNCENIQDWLSFHEEFARVFGFPDFYGKNMDAWIDCLTSLDVPADGMSGVHCEPGSVLTVQLENVKSFAQRCPEQYIALLECTAFVNWRRIETGSSSVLTLSFHN
ncbi:barstar family protein [Granulicella sibirica]|uniref:barstar family protein n=1 Tax=Granulicella sibirica TaxID=2479048 RepID=UPI001F4F8E38|nr:barstar family protein [Granulicella sibirica]